MACRPLLRACLLRHRTHAYLLADKGYDALELCRQTLIYPRQYLLQGRKELLPAVLGALVVLRLIRPEARLLHAQVGPHAGRGESPSDDTIEA